MAFLPSDLKDFFRFRTGNPPLRRIARSELWNFGVRKLASALDETARCVALYLGTAQTSSITVLSYHWKNFHPAQSG
jgi:hypothetical protein